jgi:hypothetical protein
VRLVKESLRVDEKDLMLEVDISDLSRTLMLDSVAYVVCGLRMMLSSVEGTRKVTIESRVGFLLLNWLDDSTCILSEHLSCLKKMAVMLYHSTSFVCLKFGHHGAATLMRFPM